MSKEYSKKLSIIIPHYNTPDLLQKLIESIPKLNDIQVIVVDDNSDKNLDALNIVKQKYKNWVEFYSNDTGRKGAGTCRNIGLKYANGKWLLFSDADDFFLEGMYKSVSAYFDSDYDEVFFTPTSIYVDTGEVSNRHVVFEKRINDYMSNPSRENLLKLKISLTTPCSKLIRHDLIKKKSILFSEVLYFNDMLFSVKVGQYSEKIAVSSEKIYCIVRTKGSLTTHVSWDAYEVRLREYLNVCDFLKQHYSLKEMKMMHYTCLGMLYRAVNSHYGVKKYIWIVNEFLKRKIPLFSFDQIGLEAFGQLKKDMKDKSKDSKYLVKKTDKNA